MIDGYFVVAYQRAGLWLYFTSIDESGIVWSVPRIEEAALLANPGAAQDVCDFISHRDENPWAISNYAEQVAKTAGD